TADSDGLVRLKHMAESAQVADEQAAVQRKLVEGLLPLRRVWWLNTAIGLVGVPRVVPYAHEVVREVAERDGEDALARVGRRGVDRDEQRRVHEAPPLQRAVDGTHGAALGSRSRPRTQRVELLLHRRLGAVVCCMEDARNYEQVVDGQVRARFAQHLPQLEDSRVIPDGRLCCNLRQALQPPCCVQKRLRGLERQSWRGPALQRRQCHAALTPAYRRVG